MTASSASMRDQEPACTGALPNENPRKLTHNTSALNQTQPGAQCRWVRVHFIMQISAPPKTK
jgi:hypothetical protein